MGARARSWNATSRQTWLRSVRPISGRFSSAGHFPHFGTGTFYDGADNSNYNALEVKLEQRYSHGLSFLASYSWSKSIDSSTSDSGETLADPFNLRTMRGLSGLDVGQRFIASFGWELPVW